MVQTLNEHWALLTNLPQELPNCTLHKICENTGFH